MEDKEYFSHLYEIANHLNKEYHLTSALRKSLEKTVDILDLETGWIWLTEPDNKSVYLACSYNLPPALVNFPERLSGWCYCLKQYLSDDIDQAMNISEITCSRLIDINTGTEGLKFHATIPIRINDQKVGLMNLLSKESRKLNNKELTILNTISELIGTAIHRTRLQQSYSNTSRKSNASIQNVLKRVFLPKMKDLVTSIENPQVNTNTNDKTLEKAKALHDEMVQLFSEISKQEEIIESGTELKYPESFLTKREMEVLNLIKTGLTNAQIGGRLYITERTVKFHITSILSKLHANTRTEAVAVALKRGLLEY